MRDGQERLPEHLAKQVLARAARLDASDRMSVSIAELRSAALEAGISTAALDQALREIGAGAVEHSADTGGQRRRSRRWRVLAAVALVIAALGATFGVMRVAPQGDEVEVIIDPERPR